MTHYLKFAIVQGVVLAVLSALFIAGVFEPVLKHEARWVILGLTPLLGYGLSSVARKVWSSAAWAEQFLVRCGIVALQVAMAGGIMGLVGSGNNKSFLLLLVNGIYVSVFALTAASLLNANGHFLGDSDEATQE